MKTALEDPRLKSAAYAIEATDTERHLLWLRHSRYAGRRGWGQGTEEWGPEGGDGWAVHAGDLATFPVVMVLTFQRIRGLPVVFWTDTSRVVDHDMLQAWMAQHVPCFAEGRKVDAANFGRFLSELDDLCRKPAEVPS